MSAPTNCLKHGTHDPGECPRCDELAEARMIVASVVIPPAQESAFKTFESSLKCKYCGEIVELTPAGMRPHTVGPIGSATPYCCSESTSKVAP
jgi:hypothetical protein